MLPLLCGTLGIALSIMPELGADLFANCGERLMAAVFAILEKGEGLESGLRISCLRLAANVLYKNGAAQLALRREDVWALLNSTNSSSLEDLTMREWAVVAVRNATEGSERNQGYIEDLQKQSDKRAR